jgi:hypothetical protein
VGRGYGAIGVAPRRLLAWRRALVRFYCRATTLDESARRAYEPGCDFSCTRSLARRAAALVRLCAALPSNRLAAGLAAVTPTANGLEIGGVVGAATIHAELGHADDVVDLGGDAEAVVVPELQRVICDHPALG